MLEVEKQSWIRKNIYPVALSISVLFGAFTGHLIEASSFATTVGAIGGGFVGLLIAMFMSDSQ